MDLPTGYIILIAFFCLLTLLLVSIISYLLFYYVHPLRPQPQDRVIERSKAVVEKVKVQHANPTVAVEVENPSKKIKIPTVTVPKPEYSYQVESPRLSTRKIKLQEPSKDAVTVAKYQPKAYEQVHVKTIDGDDPITKPKYCESTHDSNKVVNDILAVFDKQVKEPTLDVTAKVEDKVKAAEKVLNQQPSLDVTLKMPQVPTFEVTTRGQVPEVQCAQHGSVQDPKFCVKYN
jgi:hypothetical protein